MTTSMITAAYSTDSAGMSPQHTLPLKLRAIADAGFSHVELAFPDLETFTTQRQPGYQKLDDAGNGDLETLCETAAVVKKLCDELRMSVLVVHPFSRLEGYTDPNKRAESFSRAKAWLKVLNVLGCTMLQTGSSDDPSSSGDLDVIVRDLQELADLAAAQSPPVQIAYELWAWGVHVNTWEHTWDICQRVDRPNFGICLDTFQICARAYASPMSLNPGALRSASANLRASLSNLTATIPPSKIFYFQVSDGSKNVQGQELEAAAQKSGINPLYEWSNKWRPLPFMNELKAVRDAGESEDFAGYLPVMDVVRAVIKTGWKGPLSYEVFYERSMMREDNNVPRMWAVAGMECHLKILKELEGDL